ncbi:hypothetical protein A7U60_g4163 [Sanghuangporus baumii]|uniref:Uncharacterized protein n=1 Tax=Sanghuangporus baumii TaxID=108892 RepID=A0A9Q5HZ76_SANBA|nr:hypothetical protein A7U60_g4163 [Sanghuangporus baumii]
MDLGAVQSGRTVPLPPDGVAQSEVAMEDHEILRRLVRLLSKSEEDELYAQDTRRQPSSSAVHTLYRSKSEGDTTSVHFDRSRSVLRLAETAPLRISRPPKFELTETFRVFERNLVNLRAKLSRLQSVLRRVDGESALAKVASRMSIHLENVMSYMKQQIDILSQVDVGPPSEGMFLHARNISSAFSSLAHSTRALVRLLNELLGGGLVDDMENIEVFESLAQLAESEAQSLKDSRANESLKGMSGINFRQHTVELNTQLAKLCEDASVCLSNIIKSGMFTASSPEPSNDDSRSVILLLRDRKEQEGYKHNLRTGIAILFSVITATMLSISVDRNSSGLGLASSGIWLISLTSGVSAGITGIVGTFLSNTPPQLQDQYMGKVTTWLAMSGDVLILLAATLFSIGLSVFAFSSSQAVAARAIVIVFNSLHFLGLFALLFWLFYSRWNDKSGTKRRNMLSSMRNLAQLSIRSSVGVPTGGSSRAGIEGAKDVEKGLHLRVPSYRRSAPPIIRVTDTEREEATPQSNTPGNRDGEHTHSHIHTADHHSPTHLHRTSSLIPRPASGDDVHNPKSDSASEDGSDLTSLSFSQSHTQVHANLTVPSAQRVSSDSSRSLPALPPDVQIARCMAYSPNGMFLCIGNASPQERCTIFSTDSPAITLGELKLTDIALQIEWSEDGENILLRLSHTIYVWNAMPSATARRPAIIIHQDSDNMKWLMNGNSFLSCKKDILTSFHIDGTPTGVFQIPTTSIQDFVVTKDGQRIICLVSNFASTRSGKTSGSTQKLLVYNLENKAVEQIAPVGREASSIVRSIVSPELLLVNFTGTTPPQVWHYRQNTDASDRRTSATFVSFKRAMSFKAPSGRFAGYGIFGSTDDKLVLSVGEDGDMFIFASDTGQPLRHITTNASYSTHRSVNVTDSGTELLTRRGRPLAQCVAWDPDILTFTVCMGYNDGSIWQWKTPFDALSQDAASSTFSVITLGGEDSTLIRPPDVDKTIVHAENAENAENENSGI